MKDNNLREKLALLPNIAPKLCLEFIKKHYESRSISSVVESSWL